MICPRFVCKSKSAPKTEKDGTVKDTQQRITIKLEAEQDSRWGEKFKAVTVVECSWEESRSFVVGGIYRGDFVPV